MFVFRSPYDEGQKKSYNASAFIYRKWTYIFKHNLFICFMFRPTYLFNVCVSVCQRLQNEHVEWTRRFQQAERYWAKPQLRP